ncbi:MAG: hypothetical protein R3266_06740 [Gemmatimonadota bacterium]|nr:hypothetical protein [Gemmatimonadota bacterium]
MKSEAGRRPTETERLQQLMMAEVDRELSDAGRAELKAALESDPELRDELESFKKLKEVTDAMTPLRPPGETWDRYWEDVYRRIERGIGWVLVSIGAIIVGTWGSWQFVRQLLGDTTMPGYVRWSVLVLIAGLVILFVSVLRERLFMGKRDPYKDIIR